jgi:hypothetical protein
MKLLIIFKTLTEAQPKMLPHQTYLTTDELKENAEQTMAGYDDLPAAVRRALAECLQYVPDTETAYRMWQSKQANAEQLVKMIRNGELCAHDDGVEGQYVCSAPSRRFQLTRLLRSRRRR